MKKTLLLFILLSSINLFSYNWDDVINNKMSEFMSPYFDPCGYEKIYIENFNLEIPSSDKKTRVISWKTIRIDSMLSYFETGVYKSHNDKLYKGFRIWNSVFMFDWLDWHSLNNDFDMIVFDYYYISITTIKYDSYNNRFNKLTNADNYPLIARKKGNMIHVYKQYVNGKQEKYFFSFRLEDS